MSIPEKDKDIVLRLAEKVAQIAALPIQEERAKMWQRHNRLEQGKPMIWTYQIPWHEMNVDGELDCEATDSFCRGMEYGFRRTLYQWEHLPGDMIIEDKMYSSLAVSDTGFGISEMAEWVGPGGSRALSRLFIPQIESEEDVEKIKMPQVTHNEEESERRYQQLADVFGDIMPVEKRGIPGTWFAPWDALIRWWGVEKAMIDLILRPELVHLGMERLVSAWLHRLDQWEELNLLSLNNNNTLTGSGGYGYTDELPPKDFNPDNVHTTDLWGCATAQIFSEVSPEMHWEFALQYEKRWLDRFGITYYGCCEPLDLKMGILRRIPNLRKISMSAWIDVDRAVEEVGDKYVFSYKPNPAILAGDDWYPEKARKELHDVLERAQGCVVEIIMKDITTVRSKPRRLWEWADIARDEAEKFA